MMLKTKRFGLPYDPQKEKKQKKKLTKHIIIICEKRLLHNQKSFNIIILETKLHFILELWSKLSNFGGQHETHRDLYARSDG